MQVKWETELHTTSTTYAHTQAAGGTHTHLQIAALIEEVTQLVVAHANAFLHQIAPVHTQFCRAMEHAGSRAGT
jgi:hypothetical protein